MNLKAALHFGNTTTVQPFHSGNVAGFSGEEQMNDLFLLRFAQFPSRVDLARFRVHQAVVVVEVEAFDQLLGELDAAHCVAQTVQPGRVDADRHHVGYYDDHVTRHTALRRQSYLNRTMPSLNLFNHT